MSKLKTPWGLVERRKKNARFVAADARRKGKKINNKLQELSEIAAGKIFKYL